MNIEVYSHPDEGFKKGEVAFKITAHTFITVSTDEGVANECTEDVKDIGMVTTKEDYEKKLYTHKYNPVLFLIDLPLRIAYLYGCLNISFRHSRDEEFMIWWRKIGENDWNKWFAVKRYRDSIYGEPPSLEYR